MSEPTSTWQKVFNQAQESRQALDRFYERVLTELHASESDRIRLAEQIKQLAEQARWDMEVHHIDLLLRDMPYNPETALDEIFQLCQKHLKEEGNAMEQSQKIAMIKELRVGMVCKIEEVTSLLNLLERGDGAREIALARTKLQEAKHWCSEALAELGHKLPGE